MRIGSCRHLSLLWKFYWIILGAQRDIFWGGCKMFAGMKIYAQVLIIVLSNVCRYFYYYYREMKLCIVTEQQHTIHAWIYAAACSSLLNFYAHSHSAFMCQRMFQKGIVTAVSRDFHNKIEKLINVVCIHPHSLSLSLLSSMSVSYKIKMKIDGINH